MAVDPVSATHTPPRDVALDRHGRPARRYRRSLRQRIALWIVLVVLLAGAAWLVWLAADDSGENALGSPHSTPTSVGTALAGAVP